MHIKKISVLLLIVCLSAAASSYDGGFGFGILDLKAGGKAVALGGAFTAVADDATAVMWNPAGLALVDGDEFTLFYDALDGFFYHHAYLGYTRTLTDAVAIGFGLKMLLSGLQDVGEGVFYENQYLLAGGVSFNFPFKLKAGLTLKAALKKFSDSTGKVGDRLATFFNLDLGLLYPLSTAFNVAIKVENVIPNEDFGYGSEDEPVYTKLVFGTSLQLFDEKVRMSFDLEYLPLPSFLEYRFGLEYRLFRPFSIYAGLNGTTVSFGFNYYFTDFSFYALTSIQSSMDPGMQLALHYKIGKKKREYKSIEYQMKELSRGLDYFARGRYQEAGRAFGNVLEENPKNKTAMRLNRISTNRLASGDWRTEDEKKYMKKLFNSGVRLYSANELPEARKRFKKILEVDPLHWKTRDYLEKIDKRIRNRVRKGFRIAVDAFIRNDLKKAGTYLREVLDFKPEHSQAQDLLSRVRRLQKEAWEKGQREKRRIENAEIYFKRGLAFFNRRIYIEARESLGISLSYLKSKKARYYYDQCNTRLKKLEVEEKDSGKSRDLYIEALQQITRKKLHAAVNLLEKSLNYDPGNAPAEKKLNQLHKSISKLVKKPYDKGVEYYNKGEYIKALAMWRKALHIDPDYTPAKRLIRNTAGQMKKRSMENLKLADIHYKRGIQTDDNKEATDQLIEAMRYYKNALDLWSENRQAKLGWERCQSRLEEQADRYYTKAYDALKSNNPDRLKHSIEYFEKFLLIKPDHEQAKKFLTDARQKRRTQASYYAVKELEEAGLRLLNNRNYKQAIEQFKKILQYEPQHKKAGEYLKQSQKRLKLLAGRNAVMSIFNKGIQHFKIRRYDDAIKTWQSILKLPIATAGDKKNVQSYISTAREVRTYNQNKFFIQGGEFARAGRLLESRDALQEALKINKQHSKARSLLTDVNDRIRSVAFRKLKEGRALFRKGQYKQSIKVLEEAKRYRADDQRIIDRLEESRVNAALRARGDRQKKKGKAVDAIIAYEKVAQNNPEDADVKKQISRLSSGLADQSGTILKRAENFRKKKAYNDALAAVKLVLNLVKHMKKTEQVPTRFAATKQKKRIEKAMQRVITQNYDRAIRYYSRQDYKAALRYFDIVYRYNRNYKSTRSFRRIAVNAVAAAASKVAKQRRGRIQALLYQGINLYRQGKYRTAITVWRRILVISPGHSATRSYIARARFKLGR